MSFYRLSDKPVSDIMTPIDDTYTLSSDCLLDQMKVDEVSSLVPALWTR